MNLFPRKKEKRNCQSWFVTTSDFDDLCCKGYTSLSDCPEIITACRRIADMISTMTIYLMANTEKGDIRIVNELSKKVDINPSQWMTRKTWMDSIVMSMLIYGRGNAVVLPHTKSGYLDELEPIPYTRFSFQEDGLSGYKVQIDNKLYSPDDVLHFVLNPDKLYPWKGQGLTTSLKDVAGDLKQAATTKKGFMSSKWKPSLIVKVDALVEEFSTPEGRKKLLEEYTNTTGAGEPWLIPAEQFSVEQVKPLSLNDLAISDSVTLDKKTVASILGVPTFVLGVGTYNKDEWNAFINNTIRPIARTIEQEMTRKLIISPKMYLRFNMSSLYSYDLRTTEEVYSELYVRGIVTGNEVRDKMGMHPMDDLDRLVILENYIPLSKIGDQLKLKQNGEES